MKIIKLEIENVKKIKAISVAPSGDVTKVGGKNGQGKSSLLDGIMYLLGGRSTVPERPIRNGEEKASIKVLTDTGYTIQKTISPGGKEYLRVKSKDGKKISSPQSFLNDICANKAIAFDPMVFAGKKYDEQVEIMKEVSGLDFDALELDYKETFELRKIEKRTLSTLKAETEAIEYNEDLLKLDVVNVSDQIEMNNKYTSLSNRATKLKGIEASNKSKMNSMRTRISALKEEIESLKDEGLALKESNIKLESEITEADTKAEAIKEKMIPQDEISTISDRNSEIELNARLFSEAVDKRKAFTKKNDEVDAMNDKLEKLLLDKKKMISSAKFPIKGLSFQSDMVTYNDVPIDQVSQAEKIKIGMAIAFSMSPELKVALIREGSLLDDDSLALVAKVAAKYGGQVWMEVVTGDPNECDLFIEDGEVA